MKLRALCLISLFACLSQAAYAQSSPLAYSGGELPLLGVIGAGILGGGIWSVLKTRPQK